MEIICSIVLIYIFIMSIISSFLKSMHFSFFYLNTYEILNKKINLSVIKVLSLCFLILEFVVPTLALLNLYLDFFSILGVVFIYILPTIVLVIAIILGNKDVECGCFGANFKVEITWSKVIENLVYILILIYSLSMANLAIEIWHIGVALILNVIYFLFLKINYKKKEGKFL